MTATKKSTQHQFRNLRLDAIDRNPGQPRKHFDQDALNELAASIAKNDLLEPIVVRPHPDHDGRWLIIAGERRWRAAQIAGKTRVPTRVLELGEADAYVLSVAENVNRADMTVMEEADAYAQLRAYGKTVDEIADLFGKRPQDIGWRIDLLNLEPEGRDLVAKGHIGPDLAWSISRLAPGNQRVVIHRFATGAFPSQTAAREFADALFSASQDTSMFEVEEPTLEERQEHAKRARAAKSTLDQIERLSGLLTDLAAQDPAALAEALGNDVGTRLAAMQAVATAATKAKNVLRTAKAVAEARVVQVA